MVHTPTQPDGKPCTHTGPPVTVLTPALQTDTDTPHLETRTQVNAGRPGDRPPYTEQHIRDCLRRVTAVDLHRSVAAGPPGLAFTFHYAGHVLGAAMVHCTAGHLSVLYTGEHQLLWLCGV